MRFGEELVGIADKLLFYCLRTEVLLGQRQLFAYDLLHGDTAPGVALCHAGMTRVPLFPEQLGTKVAMLDIMVLTKAVDLWCLAEDDSYVVQHSSLTDELKVDRELRVAVGYEEGTVAHLKAMRQQDMPELRRVGIIAVDDVKRVHRR